jgi:23S rRNA-/tRNA-specific pseudouridylate synthase
MKRERVDELNPLTSEEPMIVIEGKLRRVLPYWFTFSLNVKQRMMNKTVLEAMSSEFNVSPEAYYRAAIADGRIRVNGEVVASSTLLKGHDVVSHRVHRHEPPVMLDEHCDLARPILIVAETDSFLAVSKPASVPVHPTGVCRI